MRAGYLTKANRDEIGANVPREIKDRFARIIGSDADLPEAALVGVSSSDQESAFPSAASISLTASSLAHSAGPASVPSSQPLRIDQQRGRHAERLADRLEVLKHLRARIRVVAELR